MRYAYLLLLFLLSIEGVHAQKKTWNEAENYFNSFQYAAAAKLYEQIRSVEPDNRVASERLAVCYKKLNDPEKSEIVLASLCANSAVDPMYIKMYAEVLAENAKYDKAIEWYKKYISLRPDDDVKQVLDGYTTLAGFYRDSIFYKVEKVGFNSDQADFSPVYYKEGIAFCSARNSDKPTYLWDNSSFIDLYWVNDTSATVAFEKAINSEFHEGPATFSSGFDTLFFTRNNKQSSSHDAIIKLKIVYSVMVNGKWGPARNIPLNNDEYSVGHPALSPDHKLYFVSDMPGGLGGTDIYYTKLEKGKWAPPVNLGAPVNSAGNELFPFIDEKGDLFFASNGHPGLGGLDIFHSVHLDQKFEKLSNMGYPINSSRDDFSLIVSGKHGYFSSNRGSQSKDDNIYSFSVEKAFPVVIQAISKDGSSLENFTLSIVNTSDKTIELDDCQVEANYEVKLDIERAYKIKVVKDGYQEKEEVLTREAVNDLVLSKKPFQIVLSETVRTLQLDLVSAEGLRLVGGTIWLVNPKTKEIKRYAIQGDALPSIELTSGIDYEITGQHTGFKTRTESINAKSPGMPNLPNTIAIELVTNEALFEKNEIGQMIEMEIKYDRGKATIRKDAARELDKLVEFLIKNPSVKIELGSHTDTRGTEEDNLKLSQRRAESAVQYIIDKGIESERLIPLGFGEDDLKVQNAIKEGEHQQNRRTTVKIVGI